MRLISCYIENFGKLSGVSLNFEEPSGIKVICENNGWGKSSLAAFIKVMFFGFDNEGKRNPVENERQRYKPWQGGAYGGRLTFETAGKTYIISRIFGTKEKDDEFRLQDAETGLESDDFSANIGEELFGIDRASFARSIYISQNDCTTAVTDSINARLGNLADNTDDLNNYETVAKKLADGQNALSKTRKTGELYRLKEQIAQLKQESLRGEALDASMEKYMELKNRLHEAGVALKEERKKLQVKQKALSAYKDLQVKKKEYEHLCEAEAKKKEAYEQTAAGFPNGVPQENEIDQYIDLEYRIRVLKEKLDGESPDDGEKERLARAERHFAEGIPAVEEIEAIKSGTDEIRTLRWDIEKSRLTKDERDSLDKLRERFNEAPPTGEEIDRISKSLTVMSEKKNALNAGKTAAEMLGLTISVKKKEKEAAEAAAGKRKRGVFAALAGLIVVACTGLFVYLNAVLANAGRSALIACGAAVDMEIVLAVVYLFVKHAGGRQAEDEDERELSENAYDKLVKGIEADEELINDIAEEAKRFYDKYGLFYDVDNPAPALYSLREDLKQYDKLVEKARNGETARLEKKYNELCREVGAFFDRYGICADKGAEAARSGGAGDTESPLESEDLAMHYISLTYKLEEEIKQYKDLKNRKENNEKAYEEYRDGSEKLQAFIGKVGFKAETGNMAALLNAMKSAGKAYLTAKDEYEEAVKAKTEYEAQNREFIDRIKNEDPFEDDASLADIEERLSDISAELEKYHSDMAAYDRQLYELQESRDEVTEAENRLKDLQELYANKDKKLTIMQQTQKCLEQAKISLTAKYTKPVKDGFDRYFKCMCDIEHKNYQLDANLKMSVIEQGMPRDTAFLSAGYKDMTGICMRMALIDAMYKGEKPFVIFDDPFVNLDEEKTKGAMEMLKMIAGEYQVVYFTSNTHNLP